MTTSIDCKCPNAAGSHTPHSHHNRSLALQFLGREHCHANHKLAASLDPKEKDLDSSRSRYSTAQLVTQPIGWNWDFAQDWRTQRLKYKAIQRNLIAFNFPLESAGQSSSCSTMKHGRLHVSSSTNKNFNEGQKA